MDPKDRRPWPRQPEHVGWSLLHQVSTRALLVIKFFAAARLLGPEAVGLVAVATLSMAVVEAMTETGLQQAVIQNRKRLDAQEAGALWTLQLTRGALIFVTLTLCSGLAATFFKAPAAAALVTATAVIAVLRGAVTPGPILRQRDRDFRSTAFYEVAAGAVDLTTTLALIAAGAGPMAMIAGSTAGEGTKLALSWLALRAPLQPNLRWGAISHLTHYGKWIWGNSVLTLLLNQLDKILVGRYLGIGELGIYQMAARIGQLLIAEPALAFGQYLFPTYARLFRASEGEAHRRFLRVLRLCVLCLLAMAALVLAGSGTLIDLALGDAWKDTHRLTQLFVFPMAVGALIAMLVPYLRAIGQPQAILVATLLQLLALAAVAPWLLPAHQATGMVLATGIAGCVSLAWMLFAAVIRHREHGGARP